MRKKREPAVEKTCPICGDTFKAYVSQDRTFCSRACFGASMAGRRVAWAGAHLDPEHFYSFVDKTAECWVWNGSRNAAGYGHISVNGKKVLTHRHSYLLEHGAIPEGLFILHRCDNPPCVRPSHLYAGTKKRNAMDRVERGRSWDSRGENHPTVKLTEAEVLAIRSALSHGAGLSDLGRQYGVTPQAIYQIKTRRAWRHI